MTARATVHVISIQALQDLLPELELNLEYSDYYEELPALTVQQISSRLEELVAPFPGARRNPENGPYRLAHGDIVLFDGMSHKFGRFFVRTNGDGFELIREDSTYDVNELGDHMGQIPSVFQVPSEFPPRYWDNNGYETVPFDGQTFDRPLDPAADFFVTTVTERTMTERIGRTTVDSFLIVVLPIRVRDEIFYISDLQPVETEQERLSNALRLINEVQTHPVERIRWLRDDDNVISIDGIDKDHLLSLRDV